MSLGIYQVPYKRFRGRIAHKDASHSTYYGKIEIDNCQSTTFNSVSAFDRISRSLIPLFISKEIRYSSAVIQEIIRIYFPY